MPKEITTKRGRGLRPGPQVTGGGGTTPPTPWRDNPNAVPASETHDALQKIFAERARERATNTPLTTQFRAQTKELSTKLCWALTTTLGLGREVYRLQHPVRQAMDDLAVRLWDEHQ